MDFKKSFLAKTSSVLVATAVFGNCAASSTRTVKVTSDPDELMTSLFSEEVTTKNVKVVGNPEQIGVFSGCQILLGMEDGVVLSTGFASETFKKEGRPCPFGCGWGEPQYEDVRSSTQGDNLPDITGGPDDYQFDEDRMPKDTQKTEDKDVEKASGSKHSYDSISLEFDVIPETDKIELQYVYASNEWGRVFTGQPSPKSDDSSAGIKAASTKMGSMEYVAPDDTAIVLVNGKNVAKVPGAGTVLSAKNILEASDYDTSQYNLDRMGTMLGTKGLYVNSVNNLDFGFLGRTTVMKATADVTPNEVNHVKIALSDVEDPCFNTALFIKMIPGNPVEDPEENGEENGEGNGEGQGIVNPKTGDINLGFVIASTLASATGLSVLVKKMRKK